MTCARSSIASWRATTCLPACARVGAIDRLPSLSCGPRRWRDSVVSLAKCRRCTCVNTISGKALVEAHTPVYIISGFSTSASALVRCRGNQSIAKQRFSSPEDMEQLTGRFRESAQAPTRLFQTSRYRDTVDAAQNVVRSLLREIDDEVTRKKTGHSRSETPWFKRPHSSSETTATPIPPPQTALRLMHPPPPPTVVTTSDANEEPTDFRQLLVASVPRGEPGGWRHGFPLTSLSTSALNGFFEVADRKGKAQFSQVHWPWCSSALAITFRLLSDPSGMRCARPFWRRSTQSSPQSSAWLDDVKTLAHRSMRCVVLVHPYTCLLERDPPSAYPSMTDPYVG